MSELEEKLGSILNNPQMMQQIMGMANMLSQSQEPPVKPADTPKKPEAPPTPENPLPQMDPGILQKLAGLARQGSIDQHQLGLLKALHPYLSRDRIARLERAMHAARMANAASAFLNSGGLKLLTGR